MSMKISMRYVLIFIVSLMLFGCNDGSLSQNTTNSKASIDNNIGSSQGSKQSGAFTKITITSKEKITGLYVAYFNRASDQEGLEFWNNKATTALNSGDDASVVLKELSASFAKHPTFTSTYKDMGNQEFVEAIYQNSLGKNGDAEGIAHWTKYLDGGKSRSDMVSEFIEASLSVELSSENFPNLTAEELAIGQERQDLISNKVEVALSFTNLLGEHTNVANASAPENDIAYKASIKILANIDDDSSVADALAFLKHIQNDKNPIERVYGMEVIENLQKNYLIDSPLQGVSYFCDGIEGLTDADGMFMCLNTPVTFKIGNLTIGMLTSFTSDRKVYPQDILGLARTNFSDSTLKLLARFLQSLDDGDIENRITITKEVREQITEVQDFKGMSESEVKALLSGIGKSLVNECGALKHLGDTSVECESDGSYQVVSSSGGGSSNPTPTYKIKLLSPSLQKGIDYSYLTLEIDGNVADVKAKVNGVEYIGVKNGSSNGQSTKLNGSKYAKTIKVTFFIHNVALQKGKNTIELIADGGSEKRTIEIDSEGKGVPPIGVNADKREGFEKLDTTINIQTTLSVSEYMLDKENDGVIDESKGDGSFAVSYNAEGRFFPIAMVKTSDGVIYSTQKNISLDVKAKPTVQVLSSLSSLDVIDMQIFSNEKYYILTASAVYEINEANDIVNTININANSPEGFFVDRDENIFIANTGANQVIRFSKANNYQQTMAFGLSGSANGEFNQPKDLVVEDSGEQQKIYVLDSGNNRVQVFNYVGAYLYSFDGSTTPTGKLNNPTSMVGYFAQPLVIVDSGNGVIRTLQCSQGQAEHEVSVIKDGISANIGKITMGSNLIVPDKGAKKILFFQNNYWLKKAVDVDKVPNIAISNDGLDILVANEGESGVINTQISIDPKGAEPMDVAKEFVKALIDGDRDTVERLVGNSPKSIDTIYGNQTNLNNAIDLYKQITSWHSQTYHTTGYATVKAHIKTATDEFDATFELTVVDTQIKTSRVWIVKRFY